MILGYGLLSYVPFPEIRKFFIGLSGQPEEGNFMIMMLTGFIAQMVDGSLGLGYGTISTTFLLANGVNPAIVSIAFTRQGSFPAAYRGIAIIVSEISTGNCSGHW